MRFPRTAARGVVVLVAACGTSASPAEAARRLPTLDNFGSCSALVDEARDAAQEPPIPFRGPTSWSNSDVIVPRGPFSKPDPNRVAMPDMGSSELASAPIAVSAPASSNDSAGAAEVATSTTNVQEAGIDEPDLVKTAGGHVFVVAGTALWALDATGDTPRVLGKLDLEGRRGTLLVEGTRALLLSPRVPRPEPSLTFDAVGAHRSQQAAVAGQKTRITELDIADPAAMRILRTMDVPGDLVTARLTDGTARIVLNSAAALEGGVAGDSTPTLPADGITARTARKLGTRSFIPRTRLVSRISKHTFVRPLTRCVEVMHPEEPVGTNLLTVLTVDMRKGLFNIGRTAVLGSAQVVYASPTGLYVASSESAGARTAGSLPRRPVTEIHRFDTSVREQTTYASTGIVTGFVLNQYAMSESGGVLRVATTKQPGWLADAEERANENYLTTLREDGAALRQLGQLRGLGVSERIYATRFIGDTAYLVTFRQTDPLYTLDLSDPERPKVAGELHITGYSAYLHPVGDDLLLGIGREATPDGHATGAAISLFDVADPAAPKLLARKELDADSRSSVEFDPHAFLWWAPTKLALVPNLTPGTRDSGYREAGSLVGVRADRAGGIADVGSALQGPDWDHPQIKRSVVVGSRVLTLSDLGVSSHALGDLSAQGSLPWLGS